jgi:hypothetical protein
MTGVNAESVAGGALRTVSAHIRIICRAVASSVVLPFTGAEDESAGADTRAIAGFWLDCDA